MKALCGKIVKRLSATGAAFRQDCHFSSRLAWYRMVDDVSWRLGAGKLSGIFHEKKDEWILDYLAGLLVDLIEKYRDDSDVGEKVENAPVWVCWWSGEEDAPQLVRQCIWSIRKNAGSRPVHLITERTYSDYLDIPPCILDKVSSGAMCLANFSDYLRVSLLERYGGLWLDATIFCARTVPEECFEQSLFTCKSQPAQSRYLSRFRWTGFCVGGWRGHVFYRFLKEAFERYWAAEPVSIDYLLFDYLIELTQRHIPAARQAMEAVPVNNLHRDDLQAAMYNALPADCFESVIQPDTALYKLSWRERYAEKTADGRDTIYSQFISQHTEE